MNQAGRHHIRHIFGRRQRHGFMGVTQNVTLVDGRLNLNALPLIPQSETKFESTGAAAEFLSDASGKVTRLALVQTEGNAIYERKP